MIADRIYQLAQLVKSQAPVVDRCWFRIVDHQGEFLSVRQDQLEPPASTRDLGIYMEIAHNNGQGYACTNDLSLGGIRRAFAQAKAWAGFSASSQLFKPVSSPWKAYGNFQGPQKKPWNQTALDAKIEFLLQASAASKISSKLVDRYFSLWHEKSETLLVCIDGGEIAQKIEYISPRISISANQGNHSETRTFHGDSYCRQGGMEILDEIDFPKIAISIAEEALELLKAPNCPEGKMDIVVAPDQMILQIHESIGHPLELDRILGDERNYAGASFVKPEMFGNYQYGSQLLNVTFDPTIPGELASYGFDDDGMPATKQYLIKDGVLLRGLGGAVSQSRLSMPGVANSRSENWNRPPIDRMANLNVEPGSSSVDEMIGNIENGIYLQTNSSWSIDDLRNKFQFGCERGRLIKDGQLGQVVRTPGYRGISSQFWQSLFMVGDESTVVILGTPHCGKGEPNQVIRVGHSSPVCSFRQVEVFGGMQ